MARLTMDDVESLRAESEPMLMDIATYSLSDSYKSQHCNKKPQSKSMVDHFSIEASNFRGSALKRTAKQHFKSRLIPLGIGRPIDDFYPWESIALKESFTLPQSSHTIGLNPNVNTIAKRQGLFNLSTGLNYSHSVGQQPLLRFITEHVEIIHNPPYRDWSVCLTCGSTSALEIALRMFCNRGNAVLTEEYTYPGFISSTQLLGVQTVGIRMDDNGLIPEELARTLRTWDDSTGSRPRVLYTIPSGQNPTGITQSLERKKAIYQVAEEYDLIIIEDDPYYFLQATHQTMPNTNAIESYISHLPPTFLPLDHSSRVIRLDSTSKILASGLRAGWVTSSNEIIEKFISYQEVGPLAMSGPTQLMLWNLLDAKWGHRGFMAWLEHLSRQYRARLDIVLEACEKYLPKDVCSWKPPDCGMFLWIQVAVEKHSEFRESGFKVADVEERIWSRACENGVQVTKGSLFNAAASRPSRVSFRLTYAAADEDELDKGVKLFANAVREEVGLERVE
ncbi:aromatic aminotransferase Aro8 [Mollisia scopiformis]|uniref:Aromatic aminotransferase Aro8 n=1 Tax=Mollisia scopiformis TaxID=149040 RepID=A0A132B9F5_MOLSC|nr:aromatic aminotransferase Aro8 [Mollisia scopiformis]KUJ09038.1 aromatic aminotransferase Aro8 [Mollisia scopiformis]